MGAWGTRTFQNDDALDWLGALVESSDEATVRGALELATSAGPEEYLESPAGQQALAAAELVAAAVGRAGDGLPEEARAWVAAHGSRITGLLDLARLAVMRVMANHNSEIRDLWSTAAGAAGEDVAAWERNIAELERRLAPA
jgi:hypothetical protein